MDALEVGSCEVAAEPTPAEKLAQALEMMSMGFRLKRSSLRARFPEADDAEIDRLLTAWLVEDV